MNSCMLVIIYIYQSNLHDQNRSEYILVSYLPIKSRHPPYKTKSLWICCGFHQFHPLIL